MANLSAFPLADEADWRRAAEAALKGGRLDALVSRTSDGIPLGPLYAAKTGPRAIRGEFAPWRLLARLDAPEAGDAADQALDDLGGGADGLQVVFAGAAGAYGFGLARWDPKTLDRVFDSVRFDAGARFELDLGPDAQTQARGFGALVARSGAELARVDLSFGIDPLGALARSGRAPRHWVAEARGLTELVHELRDAGFRGPFVAADARAIHAAGGTPVQELAFALGAAASYLRALTDNGFSLADAEAAIGFRLTADADQYVTLSKFRAMRLLWGRVVEACGLAPTAARIHAESAWRTMTARDPFVNVMRGALAAFSAGLGGADSVALLPFSQAVGLPDAFARRLARNSQLIPLRESHLGFVADPAAGAGVFETLTRNLCERAWARFSTWEGQGGLPAVLADGGPQREIADAALALSRDVATVKTLITGVTAHPDLAEVKVEVLPAAPREIAFPGEAFAPPLAPMRIAAPFERLRDAADAMPERPRLFLAAIGSRSQHGRRVGFARETFEAGGFAVIEDIGAAAPQESATRFAASGAKLACICGSDEAYLAQAGVFALALRGAGAAYVLLAGRPREHEEVWRATGVDAFIFAGANVLAALETALTAAGARF